MFDKYKFQKHLFHQNPIIINLDNLNYIDRGVDLFKEAVSGNTNILLFFLLLLKLAPYRGS